MTAELRKLVADLAAALEQRGGVPDDLAARVAAVTPKQRGRPKLGPALIGPTNRKHRRAALMVAALERSGIDRARAVEKASDALSLDESKVYVHANEWREYAAHALDAFSYGVLDLIYPDEQFADIAEAADLAIFNKLPEKPSE